MTRLPSPFDPTFIPSVANRRLRVKPNSPDIDHSPEPSWSSRSYFRLAPVYGRWLQIMVMALLIVLFGRLVYLQLVQGSQYRGRADANRIRTQTIPAPRGSMIDRNGHAVVSNAPNFTLAIVPVDLPVKSVDRTAALQKTADLAGIPLATVEQTLKNPRQLPTDPVPVVEHVLESVAIEWMIASRDWPWVVIEAVPSRDYVLGSSAASWLGYIGIMSETDRQTHPDRSPLDAIGKTGLEKEYDAALTGHDGQRSIERDVQGQQRSVLNVTNPIPGNTLKLSVDADLQRVLHDRLAAEVQKYPSHAGAAVAINPQTGEILAMDSEPTYDDQWFVTSGHQADIQNSLMSPDKPLLDRPISGQYPSGSIIKPMLAAAGLQEKVITPSTTVNSTGGIKVGHDFFPDWKVGGHGVTDVFKAIAESVNTFFYILGGGTTSSPGLGVDRIVKYLQQFGWGTATGIDLPSEAGGFLPTKEWRTTKRPTPWMLGDTYHLSIGQGDLQVTPLQVANAYAAIANGGTLYTPHLVTDILDPSGKLYKHISPSVIRHDPASASAIATVRQAMRDGVLNGSSRSLQSLPVPAAGKTGTAQFGNQGKTHSWYGAFAPYDNPTIVIVVIVEGGGEGNAAALPVAKDVLQWYFTRPLPALDTQQQNP